MLIHGDISQVPPTPSLPTYHRMAMSSVHIFQTPLGTKPKTPPGLLQELGLCGSPAPRGTERCCQNRDVVGSQHPAGTRSAGTEGCGPPHREPRKFSEATRKGWTGQLCSPATYCLPLVTREQAVMRPAGACAGKGWGRAWETGTRLHTHLGPPGSHTALTWLPHWA